MDNLFVFMIMGLFLYLIFFRKGGMGGMGCCGGHSDHSNHGEGHTKSDGPSGKSPTQAPQEEVIDLRKDQYAILNPRDEKPVYSREIGVRGRLAMKRLALVSTVVIAAAAFAFPAYAMGGGMGGGMSGGGMGGSGMMGNSGSGLLDWFQNWRNGSEYNHPPGQEREQMGALDQQHDEDSAYLKYQIQMKEKELDALLDSPKPDLEKVRHLRKGIRELRAEANQEQRNYELEAGKMNPGDRSGNSDGRSSYGSPGRSGTGGMGYGGRGMGNGGPMGGYSLPAR
jgi:hypothetical protein